MFSDKQKIIDKAIIEYSAFLLKLKNILLSEGTLVGACDGDGDGDGYSDGDIVGDSDGES